MKKTLPEPINEQVEAHVRAILNQNEIVKSVKSEAQNVNASMALKNIVNFFLSIPKQKRPEPKMGASGRTEDPLTVMLKHLAATLPTQIRGKIV